MSSLRTPFPKDFLWGAAAASYQVEGGIENTDWAQAAREGKVPPCGRADDHYHRYEEDFDIAKELGHTAHRLSVEWARIEPEEGRFDEAAIAHYRKVLEALRVRGIEPYVTCWHFTLPLWFAESGGFEREDASEVFARYCGYVAEQLGDLVVHIATMNEPYVYSGQGWLRGAWPPFKRVSLTDRLSFTNPGTLHEDARQGVVRGVWAYLDVLRTLALAHNAAAETIKRVRPEMKVSLVKQVIAFDANWNPLNKLRAAVASYFWTHRFMRRVRRHCDEVGLNYYHYKKFGDRETYEKTDMGWDMHPEKIHRALRILGTHGLPVYVSEAGLADHDDSHRSSYITEQVRGVAAALADGVDVRAHLYWSLLDNYEWALGFEKRFGLVAVNYDTLERTPRPSAYVYKQIIERNGMLD